MARLAGASYYDQVISIPRKPWTYAGSTGSDSDSRSRVDEFGKQSWAVNAVPRRCRSESPALIRTRPPLWSILCGESLDRADLTPGSGVGARRRHTHGKTYENVARQKAFTGRTLRRWEIIGRCGKALNQSTLKSTHLYQMAKGQEGGEILKGWILSK